MYRLSCHNKKIHNMFSAHKKLTVHIVATAVIIHIFCVIIPASANSEPLSLVGEEPAQQPLESQPESIPVPERPSRARPIPRRRPSRPGLRLPGIKDVACLGSDIAVNRKFKDEKYMRQQLDCVLEKGPCDDTGKMIKRFAPDVLKGHCPTPCTICTRRQIKRVMGEVQRKYPRQFSEMLRSFSRRS